MNRIDEDFLGMILASAKVIAYALLVCGVLALGAHFWGERVKTVEAYALGGGPDTKAIGFMQTSNLIEYQPEWQSAEIRKEGERYVVVAYEKVKS